MSEESLRTAGILLAVLPTVVFGGASLLWHWITRQTKYYDRPVRRSLWRAHPGAEDASRPAHRDAHAGPAARRPRHHRMHVQTPARRDQRIGRRLRPGSKLS
jgi:hypothetical protein